MGMGFTGGPWVPSLFVAHLLWLAKIGPGGISEPERLGSKQRQCYLFLFCLSYFFEFFFSVFWFYIITNTY